MVMNSGMLTTMSVCMPEVQNEALPEQNVNGPVVDGAEASATDAFDSAMETPPVVEQNGGCHGNANNVHNLSSAGNDSICGAGPVSGAGSVPGAIGAEQTARLGDIDLDTLVDILSNEAFQQADPEMQKAALSAAFNHDDPNTALSTLNQLVQSDLFQGLGFEGVLAEQDMGALRSMLLGVFGTFARAQSGVGKGTPMVPGIDTPVSGGPVQGNPSGQGSSIEPVPTTNPGGAPVPVGNGNEYNVGDSEAGQGCSNHQHANNGVGKEAGVDENAQPAADTEGVDGFAQLSELLEMLLEKLGKSDAKNGTSQAVDLLNMLTKVLEEIAANLGGDNGGEMMGAMGNIPVAPVSAPIEAAPAQTQPAAADIVDAVECGGHSEQAFMSAFSQVL